jgi:FlaA1/EpsC-like NDP-sugar epimerase
MGNPLRIVDLVRGLIRLHGYEPDRDIPIQDIGLWAGEKLYEELITEGEDAVKTNHEKIPVLQGNSCDSGVLHTQVDALLKIIPKYDAITIKQKLQDIVPEYTPRFSG